MKCQTELQGVVEEKDEFDKMDVNTSSLFVNEGNDSSDGPSSSSPPAQGEQQALAENTLVTNNTHLGANIDSPPPSSPTHDIPWLKKELRSRYNTLANEAETTDFGRWTLAEEDENNLITPEQARTAAGIETDGKIVA